MDELTKTKHFEHRTGDKNLRAKILKDKVFVLWYKASKR